MGKSRTELTRLSLLPLYDIESALFVPVTESELEEFIHVNRDEQQESAVHCVTGRREHNQPQLLKWPISEPFPGC